MNRLKPFLTLFFILTIATGAVAQRASFNENWKFSKKPFGSYTDANVDDSDWQQVTLPHDWAIYGPFAEEFGPRSGGLPSFGTAWYRKTFTLPPSANRHTVSIEFDGAMNNSEVWVNGHFLGKRPYGYISFAYDLSPFLKPAGEQNIIAVKLSPKEESSRWYPGAGIYRNAWLNIKQPVHVAHWGTHIKTPVAEAAKAKVWIQTQVTNQSQANADTRVEVVVLNADGKTVGRSEQSLVINAEKTGTAEQEIAVTKPIRWDVLNPYLYKAVTTIRQGNEVTDRDTVSFGIRKLEFVPSKGFLLNDRVLRINGVCNHHDLGALGAAVNTRAIERQLQIMKEMGANSIRTTHNPAAPELLDLCDKMGILVIEEAFDAWKIAKVKNDYSLYFDEWHERDLRDMIRRDRNHPSIYMWSLGNEIPEQADKNGWKITKELSDICHEEDNTRPTTAGLNKPAKAIENKFAENLDVVGINYRPALYDELIKAHPDWVFIGSENESTVSSRGIYHLPIEKYEKHPSNQVSGYDIISPSWAYPPDVEFDALEKYPSVIGEYVWTGFDYLGEPTPYGGKDNIDRGTWKGDWPSRSSYFGIVDLAGIPKDRYYLYQSQWTTIPMIHLLPHWNWKGMEGKTIPVFAYTNCDEAELFVNGKSAGRKVKGKDVTTIPISYNTYTGPPDFETKYRLRWDVPYEAGSIRVVGYKNGKAVADEEIKTAGKPSRIGLEPDRKTLQADGSDLSFITVKVLDKDGNLCPEADNMIWFDVQGAGTLEAVDNGNAASTLSFKENYRPAFSGKAMLIVRTKKGQSGPIIVKAVGEGLSETQLELTVK